MPPVPSHPREIQQWMRGLFRYHFDGGLAEWSTSRARGWCACAEVGAYAAAMTCILWPGSTVWALIEGAPSSDQSYSHLRLRVMLDDGQRVDVDPFANEARVTEAPSIDYYALVASGGMVQPAVGWRATGGVPL